MKFWQSWQHRVSSKAFQQKQAEEKNKMEIEYYFMNH